MILQKRWVRIVFSLFIGGAIQEIVRIKTGKEMRFILPVIAIVSYLFFSFCVHYYSLYKLQKRVDQEFKENDELIDDSI